MQSNNEDAFREGKRNYSLLAETQKLMFKIDNIVTIRPMLETFHYNQSPFMELDPILKRLQLKREAGMVKKIDNQKAAVGVLFPKMKELLWFKTYELQRGK